MARPLRAKYTSSTSAALNALTGIANTTEYITTLSAHGFTDGNIVKYTVSAGNTAISGLTNGYNYYVTSSNTTALKLTASPGGAVINLTAGSSEQGHSLTLQNFAGVQEMSNAEISDVISAVMLNEFASGSHPWSQLRITNNSVTAVAGYLYSTAADITTSQLVGGHPAVYQTTYKYLYESNPDLSTSTAGISPVPVCYDAIGNVTAVKDMSDTQIQDVIFKVVAGDLANLGTASYYLAPTGSPPAGGTWTSQSTVTDVYANTSSQVTESYTLYQKTSATPIGFIRPLKKAVAGVTQLVEMTNDDIKQWVTSGKFGAWIRDTGIGTYDLSLTVPSTGTWVAAGSLLNKYNDLSDVAYNGFYSTGYTSQAFTQAYTRVWTRNLAYATPYTSIYTNVFTQAWTMLYTNVYTQHYTDNYTHGITDVVYTRVFNATYTGTYTGAVAFVGSYSVAWTGPAYFAGYARANAATYGSVYTSRFTGLRSFSENITEYYSGPAGYAGSYVNAYFAGYPNAIYAGTYTGDRQPYAGYYSRTNYTQGYTNSFTQNYTGVYTQVWTTPYTNIFTQTYTQNYTNAFTAIYTQLYTGAYTTTYLAYYTPVYTQAYTGIYTGLTVQPSLTTSTYTLYIRTA